MSFLTEALMKGTDWRALERAVARVMGHCGWRDVAIIGRSGDMGGDILGARVDAKGPRSWVVQVKATTGGGYAGLAGIQEVLNAQAVYGAHVAALATNGDFTGSAYKRRDALVAQGFDLRLWNGSFLGKLLDGWPDTHSQRKTPWKFQGGIIDKVVEAQSKGLDRIQYVVATGLGKTLIASEAVNIFWEKGLRRFLVLCHARDLVLQLEQGFWSQIGKQVPTRYFFEGIPPLLYDGVNFGLFQTLLQRLGGVEPGAFDVVVVDEAHHALAHGFRSCIDRLRPKFLIGMTATPWRGDGRSIDEIFGEPVARVSLIDGMAMGFLAHVDYRILCDNIDWDSVSGLSRSKLSVRDLNRRLFLPQRDDAAIDGIVKAILEVGSPRIVVFTPSIEHADRFADSLSARGIPCVSLSGVDVVERRRRLLSFSSGKVQAVTAVDVMNEGIDVPEVNLLVFMRATHSRRIFVQQLGRGLRISHGKEKVVVLDFVSDIRRMAVVADFDREAREKGREPESVFLRDGVVRFSNPEAKRFIDEWLKDVAGLGDADDAERLSFPEGF